MKRRRFMGSLSPGEKAEMFAKNSARRSAKRAAKALAEGRVPGKPGKRAFSPEEKKLASRASFKRYREKNLEKRRAEDRARQKLKCAQRAILEGRTPGVIGKERVLTDEQRIENKEKYRLSYKAAYPEKVKNRDRIYYLNNKEQAVCRARTRRARKRSVGGKHTVEDIRNLMNLQKGKCTWCLMSFGGEKPHVDHKVPIALGGTNNKESLQLLHASCNKSKAARHPVDHGLKHGLLAW